MRLYSGTSEQFINDNIQNAIADKLKLAFFDYFRYYPSPQEINSWRNSLRALSQTFQYANLLDHGVILEYQLPLTSKRLDCLICGKDEESKDNAVVIELKQWEKCDDAYGENEVLTWVGGAKREVLHPSAQVGQYKMYLQDLHTAFNNPDDKVNITACTYIHNYKYDKNDILFSKKFSDLLELYPLFTGDKVDEFKDYLTQQLSKGEGEAVLKRIDKGVYKPSKKLMNHVSEVIKSKSEYILLDEQLVVYDSVIASAKKNLKSLKKTVIIVKGGPGTGKSVIAINLMADLMRDGYNAHYATGSRAFTETMRTIIGTRGKDLFTYFNSYAKVQKNAIDVLICDEAHRIRQYSYSRFTSREDRTNIPQIQELVNAAKVSVFFIDDDQIVRPNEIGSVALIKEYAESKNYVFKEYELEAQFRCNGSVGFTNWINNTLAIKRTANVIWEGKEEFDFKILDTAEELQNAIQDKVKQDFTARMTAGFCWNWSNPTPDGALVRDVSIGNFSMPWNAKPDVGYLISDIPKANLWAYDPKGVNQVGCIYTAQGFEFDYIGVIFGKDLVYDPTTASWKGQKEFNFDSVVKRSGDKFIDLVKRTYRVLLTRGMKGCYVYFMDENTKNFFKSRIEK